MQLMKNKTMAVWLTFLAGPLGLHRFYLYGFSDPLGWVLPIPTAVGWYGVQRALELGQDDQTSWLLIPLLGFVIAACALNAIVYGLKPIEKWNSQFNPDMELEMPSGQTNWLTVFGIATSLLLGTTVLMASIVFSFQRYFEHQIEEARVISQGVEKMKP
jgi:hypothetical protein